MSNINQFPKVPASNLILPKSVVFDLEIKIFFNTKTGSTELQLFSESLKEFNTLQIAGVLMEHATALLRAIVGGSVKAVPVTDTKGSTNGNQS